MDDQLRRRSVGAPAARSLLLTILGEYVLPRGEPVWQEVPGEYRGVLRRLIVTQGDTEPAVPELSRRSA